MWNEKLLNELYLGSSVCEVKIAYCSAGGEHTVEHIAPQSNAHHQIHSVPADHGDYTHSQFIKPINTTTGAEYI